MHRPMMTGSNILMSNLFHSRLEGNQEQNRTLQKLGVCLEMVSPHAWLMKPATNDFSHLFTRSSCIKLY